jgi:hypothetical protein
MNETVHYVVMESVLYIATAGVDVLTDTVQTDGTGWTTANYGQTFDS